MIRMSVLRNYPVILNQKRLGLVQSACPDDTHKKVKMFVVSCGIHGKRLVDAQDVSMIGEGFILAQKARRFSRQDCTAEHTFVRDTTGQLAGYVSDYAVDENTFEILAAEVCPGYLYAKKRGKMWVYTYHPSASAIHELIIPAGMSSDCVEVKEEVVCECLP